MRAKAFGKEGETVLPLMQCELAKTIPSLTARTREATGYESVAREVHLMTTFPGR